MAEHKEDGSPDTRSETNDPRINEHLADEVQNELLFKLRRLPENLILDLQIVNVVLIFLEVILIISNNISHLGYWASFVKTSTHYREVVKQTRLIHALYPTSLDHLHLWRGWIVPSLLAGGAYIVTSLICLRHELYHWKPDLLEHYFQTIQSSFIGRFIPQTWLTRIFHVYERKHRAYVVKHIQRRNHIALEDSAQFLKILRVVSLNLLISIFVLLVWWLLLLRAGMEADDIITLPRSYVPPLQGVAWYLCNDFFYFYPHWISHSFPSTPNRLHSFLRQTHKQHHRTKANLGIAAWYCSPTERIIFNLLPALIGPLITEVLAHTLNVSDIWGSKLVTLYVWITAAAVSSVLAHTGYRSMWNDPGKHDLHHERAFDAKRACNFGTMGFFDWVHGTKSHIPKADARAWRGQRDRQAALWEASRRSGVALSEEQMGVVRQPDHGGEWIEKE